MLNLSTFGERLRAEREKQGYSQKQFAEALGITPTRLNYWEKDKREPDVLNIKKILGILKIDSDYLLGIDRNDNKFNEEERKLIKKYRLLDQRGQQAVKDTLNRELKYILDDKKQSSMSEIASDAIQTIDKISENMFKNQNDSVRKK